MNVWWVVSISSYEPNIWNSYAMMSKHSYSITSGQISVFRRLLLISPEYLSLIWFNFTLRMQAHLTDHDRVCSISSGAQEAGILIWGQSWEINISGGLMTWVAGLGDTKLVLAQAGGVPAVGVRAVDCWQWRTGHYFHPYFLFLFSRFSRFSPSRPFLIEGVLGSKNLFSKSCLKHPKS